MTLLKFSLKCEGILAGACVCMLGDAKTLGGGGSDDRCESVQGKHLHQDGGNKQNNTYVNSCVQKVIARKMEYEKPIERIFV